MLSTCSVTQNVQHSVVTTKRRKLIGIILLAVIGGVIAYPLLHRDDEPTYQGRRLSEWLERYNQNTSFPHETPAIASRHEAEAALLYIGTNAVPHLVKWISYEPPAWRTALRKWLPASIVKRRALYPLLNNDEADRRAYLAIHGFLRLGTNASIAVPALEALMNNTKRTNSSIRTIFALGYVGESSTPALKAAFADKNRSNRELILKIIAWNQRTNVWLPTVLEALNDDDINVRVGATNVVQFRAPGVLTNAPPAHSRDTFIIPL